MSENYFYSSLAGQEIEDTLLGSVVFNKSQSLTTSQKARARANIGAGEGSTSFVVMGFFATLDDLREYLQTIPKVGDAYGVSEEPEAASEFLSPDGTQTSFTLSDDAQPYALTITEVATGTVLVRGTDYTYADGVITFPTAPAAGTDSYEVEWYDETAPYHIYVWDGVTEAWVDNGVLIGAEVIDDNDTVYNKTWSSQKIKNELDAIDLSALIDDSDTAADTTWSSQKIDAEITAEITAVTALHLSGTVTAFPFTISNAAITATMRIAECTWGTPSAVQSDVTWTTAAGSIVLGGTLASGGSTTVDLILVETREG